MANKRRRSDTLSDSPDNIFLLDVKYNTTDISSTRGSMVISGSSFETGWADPGDRNKIRKIKIKKMRLSRLVSIARLKKFDLKI